MVPTYFINNLPTIEVETGGAGMGSHDDIVRVKVLIAQYVVEKDDVAEPGKLVEIYDEILYGDQTGMFTFPDARGLLLPYVEKYGRLSVVFDLEAYNGYTNVMQFDVFFSAVDIEQDAETYLATHYLTLATARQTSMLRREILRFCDPWASEEPCTTLDVEVEATYEDRMATFRLTAYREDAARAIYMVDVSPSRMVDYRSNLLRYTVKTTDYGLGEERRFTFHVSEYMAKEDPMIEFTNAFGVAETLYINGTVETKQTVNRSTAMIDGQYTTYNTEETIQMTANSGRITDQMLPAWQDLVRARTLYIVYSTGTRQPIVLTSEKAETSDDLDHLTRFTITYRPARQSQQIILNESEKTIFDQTFDTSFE